LPTPVVAKTEMKAAMDCGGACPMMAARNHQTKRRSGHSAAGHHAKAAMPATHCGDEMGFNCCASTPAQPTVPLGEATPSATVTVPAPPATAAALLPPPAPRSALWTPGTDAPDPPAAPLFLLHGSFLS